MSIIKFFSVVLFLLMALKFNNALWIGKNQTGIIQYTDKNDTLISLDKGNGDWKIKKIDLSGNNFDINAIKQIGQITSLEEIDLCNNKIKNMDFIWIEKLVNLRVLKICSNGMESVKNSMIKEMKNLNEVDLSYNSIKVLNVLIFANYLNLNTLKLNGNPLMRLEFYDLFTDVHKEIKSIIIEKSSFECSRLKLIVGKLKERRIESSLHEMEQCKLWKMGSYGGICCYERVYDRQQEEFISNLKIENERLIHNQQIKLKRDLEEENRKTLQKIDDFINETSKIIHDLEEKTSQSIDDLKNKTSQDISDLNVKTFQNISDLQIKVEHFSRSNKSDFPMTIVGNISTEPIITLPMLELTATNISNITTKPIITLPVLEPTATNISNITTKPIITSQVMEPTAIKNITIILTNMHLAMLKKNESDFDKSTTTAYLKQTETNDKTTIIIILTAMFLVLSVIIFLFIKIRRIVLVPMTTMEEYSKF